MARRVLITGLGPVSGLGIGIDAFWEGLVGGKSSIGVIEGFNAAGFKSQLGSEVSGYKMRDYVPKSHRKMLKVMAKDIELAVIAANCAVNDGGLVTRGSESDVAVSYKPSRVGAQIGAGLIAAELNELTFAMKEARDGEGGLDLDKWGSEGMKSLTPLWLLKYLPNMLACHVTIIHDTQGPSNTITCAEASSGLSIGESLRVIQRDSADLCFCGGAESKLNPLSFLRQDYTGRYYAGGAEDAKGAVKPFSKNAEGSVVGEGGGILALESEETFNEREGGRVYAQVLGFGASQSIDLASRNTKPSEDGKGIAIAIRAAMAEAGIGAEDLDLVVPFGLGWRESDVAELNALRTVFGAELDRIAVRPIKSLIGSCAAGAGALDVIFAAKAISEQYLPGVVNCDEPLDEAFCSNVDGGDAVVRNALVVSVGNGGQNTAIVLGKYEG